MPVGLILIVTGIMVLIGLILIVFALYHFIRDKRLMKIPNTPIADLSSGEVAVRGIVDSDPLSELRTPVGNYPCVYYHTKVDYYKPVGRGMNTLVNIYERKAGVEFFITDETGTISVNPTGIRPLMSQKIDKTVRGPMKWPEGWGEFCLRNRLDIDLNSRLNNSYRYLQHYIPIHTDVKLKGQARKRFSVLKGIEGKKTEYEICNPNMLPDSFLITDAKEGKMTKEGRFRFLIFILFGMGLTAFSIFIMVTYLLNYG